MAPWVVSVLVLAIDPGVSLERATALLFPEGEPPASCAEGTDASKITCLLQHALTADPTAASMAVSLYEKTGDVVGVLPEQDFEGGYRGTIHLVPTLPTGAERRHLEYVVGALTAYETFFAELERLAGKPIAYRWRGLELRFFRSIKKRTPAAFAVAWTVSYNVNGTLNGSLPVVRNLLFHEIFHLNDPGWSPRALSLDYDVIVERCGTRIDCLTPYVPEPLIVKGGTYYCFMPGNGVTEYAADLALRYFKEQREVMEGRVVKQPFKCGPAENARAWKKLIDQFFGGVDRVPACAGVK